MAAVEEGAGAEEAAGRHPVRYRRPAEGRLWEEGAALSCSENPQEGRRRRDHPP